MKIGHTIGQRLSRWFLAACLLAGGAGAARAQTPAFDAIDWTLDRGSLIFNIAPNPISAVPFRQGANDFNQTVLLGPNPDPASPLNNNPGHAVRKGVWPRTKDIQVGNQLSTEIVDNPNAADPDNDSDTAAPPNIVRVQPRSPMVNGNNPLQMAHAYFFGAWNLPLVPVGDPNDYRSPNGGFSFTGDPTQVYAFDYGYTDAVHNDFLVDRAGGNQTPATQGELASLPYTDPAVYSAVQNILSNTMTATAIWTCGSYNAPQGRYNIDIYSPGDGTLIGPVANKIAHPNVTRAFVRVSYGHIPDAADATDVQTMDAQGHQIKAGVDNPKYSRIYLVDLGQAGWINIAPGGRTPAAFDYTGDPRYSLVVTLYTLTPDDVNDPTLFSAAPEVTADAVRFIPQPSGVNTPGLQQTADGNPVAAGNPAIYSISPSGRILGPVVGTNKYTQAIFGTPVGDVSANDTQPLIFFAREETVPNTTPIIPLDPTKPVDNTIDPITMKPVNPLIPDPTLTATAPVFYCIDNKNSNATKTVGGMMNQPTVSVDRVRWRFVGVPDAVSGSGTSSASPLLANVRCRDNVVRTILYYVTTNATGTIGHIYALDPLGDRQDTGTGINYNTTRAYWVYPSYRPLTAAETNNGQFPAQYHDPNYNNSAPYGTGVAIYDNLVTRSAAGTLSAAPPFGGDDGNAPEKSYVDGDIITNPADPAHRIVRSDTSVPFTGMQSSPIVIDDPNNVTGPQILVVGGINGRIYTFDAGGRGDYVYDRTHQNDSLSAIGGLPYSLPGTTQRYWTWPHLRGDAFHAQHGSGSAAPGLNIVNTIIDDVSKTSFPGSPAYDPTYAALSNDPKRIPFYIGGGDGHMYAISPAHDVFNGIDNQNHPLYQDRRIWVYPDKPGANVASADNQSLFAAPSTPAIFKPTGGNNTFVYFTCAGRVYAINEHPVLPPSGPKFMPNNGPDLSWVYPNTNNPPFPNPNDSFSDALDPGFSGSAPMLLSKAQINAAAGGLPIVDRDFCYVVQNDGVVHAIDASTATAGSVIATGSSLSGGNTECSPVGSLVQGIIGFSDNTTSSQPSVVFADDDGAIWAVNARPDLNTDGVLPGTKLLPLVWGHLDAGTSRLAAASLVQGVLYEGDEGGQLRSYGVGTGTNGLGDYTGGIEPAENGFGISPAGISIDLRGLNFYTAADYQSMLNGTKTPARIDQNTTFANSANPVIGKVNPGGGNNNQSTWPVAVDWGDGLYIAMYGVYHAQPQNNATGTRAPGTANGAPRIEVLLTITEPGQPSIQIMRPATPVFNSGAGGVTNGNLWPDDRAITPGEHNGISIYGVDDPSQKRNMMSNTDGEKLIGRNAGVFPWVFLYKLPIIPDATKNFTPGSAGYRVTARAVITQTVITQDAMGNDVPAEDFSENSNFLQIGQHDDPGLIPINGPNTIASPANPVLPETPNNINFAAGPPYHPGLGQRRAVFITNPLAVTVRSYQQAGGGAQDMTNNLPNIVGMGPSAATINNIYEVLGNGNRVFNPYQQTNTSPIKALFAPFGMIPHGSSTTYQGVDNAGNKISSFFIADRSNLAWTGPGGAGRPLRSRILLKPIRWLGGDTSVMNPLPWDIMPNDAQDSRDYPNLPLGSLDITGAQSGQDAIKSTVQLNQPLYPNANNPDTRVVRPTEMKMIIKVPKFQPANVNRGIVQWQRADGTAINFGSPFTDIAGNTPGNGAANNEIVGPVKVTTGLPVLKGDPIQQLRFPAGGYISELVVEAVPPGTATLARAFNPQSIFNDSRGEGTSAIQQAYRALEVGLTVPPGIKMRVVEQTVDLGKLPQGTGVSDILTKGGKQDYRVPFSPGTSLDYPANSPWEDDNQFGKFFRPITLISESNINLYDVRVGKLIGSAPGAANPFVLPLTLSSDQTSAKIVAPPSLYAAGPNAGLIGVVSSFDHISKMSNSAGYNFNDRPLWPIANPYVNLAGVQAALPSGIQPTDAPAAGLLGWTADGLQPQPTIHKPRVGDTQGIIATIPDTPYDAAALPNFTPQQPKVGLSVPIGTPVGTYSAPVYPFEDNVPLQWQEWLASSNGFGSNGSGGFRDTSHDGTINVADDRITPLETYSDPTFILKATVREARLTGSVTRGDLPQIDTFVSGVFSTNVLDANNNIMPDTPSGPLGFNLLPAAIFKPFTPANGKIGAVALYWTTNRQPAGSPFLSTSGPKGPQAQPAPLPPYPPQPVSDAPWSLAFSSLVEGAGGWTFSQPGTGGFANAQWWDPFTLFPGYGAGGVPNNLADLFPSTPTEAATLNVPYVPGTRVPRTVRYATPSAVMAGNLTAYLFWQGQIDKQRVNGAANSSSQFTESRTFYATVNPASPGAPNFASTQSLLNDPALTKISPKPLYFSAGGSNVMYLFWHAGNGSQTSLYYNFNATANFPQTGWSKDTKLETPAALVWQSDPSPVYHQVPDPVTGNTIDVIDVFYTGVLKNRRTVETLMSRYKINGLPATASDPPLGSLSIVFMPTVVQEQLGRVGATNSYTARDAAWAYGSGAGGVQAPTDTETNIHLYISQNFGPLKPLNGFTNAGVDHFPLGKFDPASGLIYFDCSLGGTMVVDSRSGTVSFPQVPPKRNDIIYASYVPQVMRLSTSRDDTNLVRTSGYGAFNANDAAFQPRPAITTPGSNSNPIAIMERDFVRLDPNNQQFTNPRVVFPIGTNATFPRLWTLYRKSDVSGSVKSTIYYKSMRLLVRLPRPIALTNNNGQYAVKNLTVNGNVGPFEVDWVRGRIYFTELDEGRQITVNYDFVGGNSGNLTYRVAWGDEISATSQPPDPSQPFVDHTTPEVVLPTDSAVNEGQVTAFQIPAVQRVGQGSGPFAQPQGSEIWVFWTSTRAGTTDLFYETIRPNFYPNALNQK